MAEKAYVTTKGQFVIPARRRLGIRNGTMLSVDEENGRLVVQPVTREFIESLKGSLKGGASEGSVLSDRACEEGDP